MNYQAQNLFYKSFVSKEKGDKEKEQSGPIHGEWAELIQVTGASSPKDPDFNPGFLNKTAKS